MRIVILKRDVLKLILDERLLQHDLLLTDEISKDEYCYRDEFLARLYHKISVMGINKSS